MAEATRQLNICNSCRYCEGFCAVFPALERRLTLADGDLVQLANLCHDCRACLYACMYSPPHEFGVNIPLVLSEVRSKSFTDLAARDPERDTPIKRSRRGPLLALVSAALLIVAWVLTRSISALQSGNPGQGSVYRVIAYPLLVALFLAASCFSVGVVARGIYRYAKLTGLTLRDLRAHGAVSRALGYAATLHYAGGGGGGCYYPSSDPSAKRRVLHSLVAYGFVLCFASTISAAVLQDFLSAPPPYGIVSAPVLLGLVGGAGIVFGSSGLLELKHRADPAAEAPAAVASDLALLGALDLLGASGLAVLLLRDTAAFGPILIVHLSAVLAAILVMPYSKFPHFVYRFLAIVKDNVEQEQLETVGARS